MKQIRLSGVWLAAGIAAAALLGSGSTAQAADKATHKTVSQIYYQNCGSYVVSNEWLHWKVGDKAKKTQYNRSLAKKDYACWDLSKISKIPDGAEVWLSFQIVLGEKEGCRKSGTHFVKGASGKVVYTSRGETLTNNRCRISDTACFGQYWGANPPCKDKATYDMFKGTDF
jgi:hypothetical protein